MLIFTQICRVVAVLGLLYSALVFWMAFTGFSILGSTVVLVEGQSNFSHGAAVLVASIALGTLAEISFSLRRGKDG
jgi:hypothetical protein